MQLLQICYQNYQVLTIFSLFFFFFLSYAHTLLEKERKTAQYAKPHKSF